MNERTTLAETTMGSGLLMAFSTSVQLLLDRTVLVTTELMLF